MLEERSACRDARRSTRAVVGCTGGQTCTAEIGQRTGPLQELGFIPFVEVGQGPGQAQVAVSETALHVALVGKGPVAQFAVVAGQRQVAEGVQVAVLYRLPVLADILCHSGLSFLFCGRMCSMVKAEGCEKASLWV